MVKSPEVMVHVVAPPVVVKKPTALSIELVTPDVIHTGEKVTVRGRLAHGETGSCAGLIGKPVNIMRYNWQTRTWEKRATVTTKKKMVTSIIWWAIYEYSETLSQEGGFNYLAEFLGDAEWRGCEAEAQADEGGVGVFEW
ncbi:MAG: hypothetical protein HWN68_19515 [Desulfobacterales bacterium]|nr:hypothetical protein [Desulfobacterales bacterium]